MAIVKYPKMKRNRVVCKGKGKYYALLVSKLTFSFYFISSKVYSTKLIDSGGGFLIEEQVIKEPTEGESGSSSEPLMEIPDDVLPLPVDQEFCLDCDKPFIESYLLKYFVYSVCDECYDRNEKHSLITRTDAKNEFLLKDCDFDKREPPLKYITRRNPHNVRWGEMKLYLRLQIEQRALEVWGTAEQLAEQHASRDEKREISKLKKFNKNMKQLRMEVRSSLYDKTTKNNHTHVYGEETYNEDDDNYSHTCTICGLDETYEKM